MRQLIIIVIVALALSGCVTIPRAHLGATTEFHGVHITAGLEY
jgi:hypothetical protein